MIRLSSKKLGQYLRTARETKNISREELAERLGVTYDTIAKWERGERCPDFEMLVNLSHELEVDLSQIRDASVMDRSSMVETVGAIILGVLLVGLIAVAIFQGIYRSRRQPVVADQSTDYETSTDISQETVTEEATLTESQMEKPKYLTLEMAKEACAGITYTEGQAANEFIYGIVHTFDAMVQIPGVDVGYGRYIIEYYLNDEHTEKIVITESNITYYKPEAGVEECIYKMPRKEIPETDLYDAEEKVNLLTISYEKADAAQKAALDALTEKYGAHACHYEREIRTIMGEIPEDNPHMTLEQAREICHQVTYAEMDEMDKKMFDGGTQVLYEHLNEVAWAPDYNDSHQVRYHYYLEDGKVLKVHLAAAIVYDANGKEEEWLFPYPGMPVD